jgi:hypothetical protein
MMIVLILDKLDAVMREEKDVTGLNRHASTAISLRRRFSFSQLHQYIRTPSNCTGTQMNTASNMHMLYTNAHITLNIHPSREEEKKT